MIVAALCMSGVWQNCLNETEWTISFAASILLHNFPSTLVLIWNYAQACKLSDKNNFNHCVGLQSFESFVVLKENS